MTDHDPQSTDFGFQTVPIAEKQPKVAEIFSSVAQKYDLMNDLMSFGLHRWWKRVTVAKANIRPGFRVLDVAGGTADLSIKFSKLVGTSGEVIVADINEKMLSEGRDRCLNLGITANMQFVQADAESLPFPDHYFDCCTIAFGLRNVTRKEKALASMYRVLKPGGKLLVLEFSKPILPLLEKVYHKFSFNVIPQLGEWICNDRASYQYLVESIVKHPDQVTLKKLIETAGFEEVSFENLTGGVVALHQGYKF